MNNVFVKDAIKTKEALQEDKSRAGEVIAQLKTIENKLNPEIPEDLNNIVMKAVNLQKHLKENRSDNRNTRALELVEAKVHRLSTHYKKTGEIDQKWKYKSVVAQLE